MDASSLTKTCPKCHAVLCLAAFSRNRTKKDGLSDWCKVCTRSFQRTAEQAEKSRLRTRRWRSIEGNTDKLKAWRQLATSKRQNQIRSAIEKLVNPHKVWARNQALLAIRRGELVRKPCEVCGAEKTDSHHDDYSKPLDVRWLCRKHHNGFHQHQKKSGQWKRLH